MVTLESPFAQFVASLEAIPHVGEGIRSLRQKYGTCYEVAISRGLGALLRYYNGDWGRMETAKEAFLQLTYDTLKAQFRYLRTGEYSWPAQQRENLHQDPELMQGPYLTGLFMASMFWQNHFERMLYFEDVVVPLLPVAPKVLDIGSGSGLFAALTTYHRPEAALTCSDVSPQSKPMVERLHMGGPGARTSPRFILGCFPESLRQSSDTYDAIVFSDIVEHLQAPRTGLAEVSRLLAPTGLVFFATATNAAFYDHTIVFQSAQEVADLVQQCGFAVLQWRQHPVYQSQTEKPSEDIFAVLRHAAAC